MPNETDRGLLPGIPARGDGRYAPGTRSVVKPWTLQEDLAIWPLLLACESERAYLRTCTVLCDWLGRVPRFANQHPTQSAIVAKSVSIIERRTVTEAMGGKNPELVSLFDWLDNTARSGLPLSWAEKNRILRPYTAKPDNDKPHVKMTVLKTFMLRARHPMTTAHTDNGKLFKYLADLNGRNPPSVHDGKDFTAVCPVDGNATRGPYTRFMAVVNAPLDDEHELTRQFGALVDHTINRTVK